MAAAAVAAGAADVRPRVLLVAPRDSYRTAPYLHAARKQGIDLLIASEGRRDPATGDVPGIRIDLHDPDASLDVLIRTARQRPFAAILGTDDSSTELAVLASARFGLRHNPVAAVRIARRKDLARQCLAAAGVPVPRFWTVDLTRPVAAQLAPVQFPCVVKPVALSASRGVIRVDDPRHLIPVIERVRRIAAEARAAAERDMLLIEEYVAGDEVAIEGLLSDGRLEVLAMFDKPDPLEGPYFEETYYITPSRHSATVQRAVAQRVAEVCAAYGLREGPVHAECRVNATGVWVLEVASRTIGGLCGRLLRFGTGHGLEELVLAHALGQKPVTRAEAGGAGVLMIPIPQGGILRRVEGVLNAQQVPHIEEVVLDVREGNELVPLPDGASYLGFIFARAPTPAEAEHALRAAHAQLRIVVAPLWKAEIG